MNGMRNLRKNEDGSTLVEFSLLMALMFLVTFSIIEIGYIMYQFNSAQKATQIGARMASTRSAIALNLPDCGAGANNPAAGTDCNATDGGGNAIFTPFSTVTCLSDSSTTDCDDVGFDAVYDKMHEIYPNIEPENLEIEFAASGLGYLGRNKPVPAITVRLKDLSYNYIAVGGLLQASPFINSDVSLPAALNFDTVETTVIAEDIDEGIGAG